MFLLSIFAAILSCYDIIFSFHTSATLVSSKFLPFIYSYTVEPRTFNHALTNHLSFLIQLNFFLLFLHCTSFHFCSMIPSSLKSMKRLFHFPQTRSNFKSKRNLSIFGIPKCKIKTALISGFLKIFKI